MAQENNYVLFDWAMKRLLRNKADYVVLEGFLTVLLGEKIRIEKLLESESNKSTMEDKFNRVDLLAENSSGELILVEVQNTRELDYFHRMIYGVSKVITEYLKEGEEYGKIRKLYSVNIVYFDFGQGEDYVYHGTTNFIGIHNHDELLLTEAQKKQFSCKSVKKLFPEYYVLRVNEFDSVAKNSLDEWISFLKTSDIPPSATAPGLVEARELLNKSRLSSDELAAYRRHIDNKLYEKSAIVHSEMMGEIRGEEKGLIKGREEGLAEGLELGKQEGMSEGLERATLAIARSMKSKGISPDLISQTTGLSTEEIERL